LISSRTWMEKRYSLWPLNTGLMKRRRSRGRVGLSSFTGFFCSLLFWNDVTFFALVINIFFCVYLLVLGFVNVTVVYVLTMGVFSFLFSRIACVLGNRGWSACQDYKLPRPDGYSPIMFSPLQSSDEPPPYSMFSVTHSRR
jgi:hypothetical protein